MALRPARTIRERFYKQSWSRWSKRNMKKNYVKALPHKDLHQLRSGVGKEEDYPVAFDLVAEQNFLHRDNAIEAARQSVIKHLEKNMPKQFLFIIRVYPHEVIRENRMVAGAGADRIQKGMRRAFGKPTDRGAKIKEGQPIFTVYTYEKNQPHVEEAFRKASRKLSGTWRVVKRNVGN